jgi:uncharacterized protein involved in exopolysaccharide biosynthesis/Mrp family chromosome partitioning ATPase
MVQAAVRDIDPARTESEGELDLRALGIALWRKKKLILLPTLMVAVATLVAVNFITPKYKSEAKIMVEGRENVFLRPEAEKSLERAAADQEAITTQVQVIQSRDIARQVIRELKLGERSDFDPVLSGPSLFNLVLSAIGIGRDRLRMTPEERVMESFYDRLTVSAVDKSRVITIEFQSSDPELSARVVNAIVDAYLKLQQEAKVDQTRGASAYLAGEIEKLRKTVLEADARVEEFRAKANLFLGANSTNLANQQLGELTTQLANARAQKADLDAKSRLIREMLKSGKAVESADIVNFDLLKRLVEQRVLLRAQLAEQSSTLLHLHPRIQELNAQINALDTQMHGELQRLVTSLENDARIAEARIGTTSDSIERLKKQISGASPQDVQLRALEREAKAQRDLLESYLARYREAAARENIDAAPAEARVISRAVASNVPAFPKKLPILLIATFATAFLAAAFVLSSEILKQGPVRPEPLQPESLPLPDAAPSRADALSARLARFIRLDRFDHLVRFGRRKTAEAGPAVAAAPEEPVEPVMPAIAESPAPRSPAVSTVEDVARNMAGRGAGCCVVVAGVARRNGTTAAALGLARALVVQGRRVVLADLALQAPSLSALSVDPYAPGLVELVQGHATFGDIITRDKFSRLHLVTSGRMGGDAQAILASPRLAVTLEALSRAYDHVVIDAGAVADMVFAPLARLSPRVVLVATDVDAPAAVTAHGLLADAGLPDAVLVHGTPAGFNHHPAAA